MAQFQANDKARTGFLAAVQARGVLLQTGLAQQTLATVWNLADIDKVSPWQDDVGQGNFCHSPTLTPTQCNLCLG